MDNEVPSAHLEGRGDRDGKGWVGDRVPSCSFRRGAGVAGAGGRQRSSRLYVGPWCWVSKKKEKENVKFTYL